MILTIFRIIISLISPIVALYLFNENKKYITQLHSQKLSIEKMDSVISSFLEIYPLKDSRIKALIKYGIKNIDLSTFNTSEGIEKIIDKINLEKSKHNNKQAR